MPLRISQIVKTASLGLRTTLPPMWRTSLEFSIAADEVRASQAFLPVLMFSSPSAGPEQRSKMSDQSIEKVIAILPVPSPACLQIREG